MADEHGDHGDEGVFFFAFPGDDDGAIGEKGFAGARDVAEEGDEAAMVGVGEGFEVVEDEEAAGAGEGVDE